MIGHQFGNYTTLALLGEGGMGSVYLAEHPAIGRRVAIKVLRQDFARDEMALGRFVNEARAANAIRHPNIIEILDSGTTATGLPYLVMELLEGQPLRAHLRQVQRLPALEALDITYLTASALAAAHGRGIVHRDLKPDNLFLVPDPNDPEMTSVKVLDFGIAKLQRQPGQLGVDDGQDSVRTQTGMLMGTPSYMSPEQCLGTKELDERTDIYSLGIILFEMLCGRTPFQSMGFGELVHMHLNVAPPRPRSLVPEISAEVEEIILRALAKRAEDRFQSMEELMGALEKASDGWLAERRKSARRFHTAKMPASAAGSGTHTVPPVASGTLVRQPGSTRWVVGLIALAVAAAGGFWWRTQQRDLAPAAASTPPVETKAAAPPPRADNPVVPPVAAPAPPPAPPPEQAPPVVTPPAAPPEAAPAVAPAVLGKPPKTGPRIEARPPKRPPRPRPASPAPSPVPDEAPAKM